jgi:hypothetical protein
MEIIRPGAGTGGHLHGEGSFFLREELAYIKSMEKRKRLISFGRQRGGGRRMTVPSIQIRNFI